LIFPKFNLKKLDQQQIVLSAEQDSFYKDNMFNNFGDLGSAVRSLVDQYQSKAKLNQTVNSIEDMKNFVKNYPEFKKLSGNVTKHMALIEELQRQVKQRALLDISELEQELSCIEAHDQAVAKIIQMFSHPKATQQDLLRIVMLYVLRCETRKDTEIAKFTAMLEEKGLPQDNIQLLKTIRSYAGIQKRSKTIDLFENQSFLTRAKAEAKRGLVGVENVYTQHSPLIYSIANEIKNNSLPETSYPYIDGQALKARPQQVIVFIVGGATYEEASCIAKINGGTVNVLLGSTHIINPKSFLATLKEFSEEQ